MIFNGPRGPRASALAEVQTNIYKSAHKHSTYTKFYIKWSVENIKT
jgi:hypothetical protein